MRTKRLFRKSAGYAILGVTVLVALTPIVWLALTSVKSATDLIAWPPKIFFSPTLDNYREIFQTRQIPVSRYFVNSVVVTLVSTVVSVALAAFAAYALSRLRPRGHRFIGLLILSVRMLPPIALVSPLFLIASRLDVLDTRLALILPYIALNIPLATWMLQGFFMDLPRELEEAALVDGCGYIRTFLLIILPLTGPGLAAVSVFSFVLAWSDLVLALPLTRSDAATLPVLASSVRTEEGIQFGQLGVIAMLIVIPVALFTVVVRRWLVRGVTAGAVK
ncbi:carbohydrate ABC transporter permease [Actinobacteria bacterium YIM 96077]|uniref:Carbohydrate ABC transporter permease n=1 Tax=Phytoactinopolyspora halophila TaxID=1981511 RepID=A0A329QC47_9ACTN|nr:carbohydrate ABC transporter permease [Phytoactinopolyspora halophila]AYY12484.1 carbohydrate ABC transporter permease [Actinobacteria bacterium YIM 96077]RAW09319.1 carbohydrate ABC transporter permease [Phytoactinopolyspora halophila]